MKLRSLQELEEAIDGETGWRKRELTSLLFDTQNARTARRPTSLRTGVALLYAHWEGWIKRTAEYYIGFVAAQRLQYDQLSEPFLALALHSRIKSLNETRSHAALLSFAKFLRNDLASPAEFGSSRSVDTGSNLSSTVLRGIVQTLGLDYAQYELLSPLIDRRMLHRRNRIAHGEYLDLDLDEFEDLHEAVLRALANFTSEVLNSAALRAYRL